MCAGAAAAARRRGLEERANSCLRLRCDDTKVVTIRRPGKTMCGISYRPGRAAGDDCGAFFNRCVVHLHDLLLVVILAHNDDTNQNHVVGGGGGRAGRARCAWPYQEVGRAARRVARNGWGGGGAPQSWSYHADIIYYYNYIYIMYAHVY